MQDTVRKQIQGPAVPVRGDDIDTDRILPARFLKCVTFDGLRGHAFEDDRLQLQQEGQQHPFDDPAHADARILIVNKNFGCGSSREHAPQGLMRWNRGIIAVIGESFAEIFFGNCVAMGIPCVTAATTDIGRLMEAAETKPDRGFELDLEAKQVRFGNNESVRIEIPEGPRQQFLEGRWDSTAELLASKKRIAETAQALPYFDGSRASARALVS